MRWLTSAVVLCVIGLTWTTKVEIHATSASTAYFSNYYMGVDACRGGLMRLEGIGFDAGVTYEVTAAARDGQFFSAPETAASDGTFIVTILDFPRDLAPGDPIDVDARASDDPATVVASYQFHMMGPYVQAVGIEGYVSYFFNKGEAVHLVGGCFLPGARVTIDSPDVRIKAGTAHEVADENGFVTGSPVLGAILRTGSVTLRIHEDSTGADTHMAVTVANAQLDNGTALVRGGALISPSGHYRLVLNRLNDVFVDRYATGINAAPRHRVDPGERTVWQMPMWHGRGPGSKPADQVLLSWHQGSLVDRSRTGRIVWSARTGGRGGTDVRMQDDGNVVMRTAARVPIWSTKDGLVRRPTLRSTESLRSGRALVLGDTQFVLQRDGNLVVYRSGIARWSTGTAGSGAVRLTMKPTGNLVLTRRNGTRVWSTHTAHTSGRNHLTIRADGDVAVCSATGGLVWDTDTAV